MLRFFKMIGHGTLMMVRTLRNYAMLSMSVVLSFSVLLGYLVYTDSTLFNEYKDVLYKPDGWVSVYDQKKSVGDIAALQKLTEEIPSYVMTQYQGYHIYNEDQTVGYNFVIYTVPTACWGLLKANQRPPEQVEITWLDGRESGNVVLGKGEILISKVAYDALLLGKEEPILPVCVDTKNGWSWMDCKVVGTVDAPEDFSNTLTVSEKADGKVLTSFHIITFMSQATMDEITKGRQTDFTMRFVIYNTSNPEYVIKAAEQVGMLCFDVHTKKSEALRELQLHAQTKMIIVLLMFVLLGINLYGSFSNALERRRFEVGIKRAIGASKAAIIGQFMWESLLLMLCNIFISMVLVFNGFLWYKYYDAVRTDFNPYWKWTIYMSGTSILMFATVTLALTLLFSVIFAVKATQVQVVEYLKAE